MNETNGDFSYYKEDVLDNSSPNIEEYIKSFNTKHLTICINISNACNLACKYCFNNFKKNKLMDFDYIQRKIIQLVNGFGHCERFYIDLSGKGEPLLNLSTIYKISEFCKSLSQKYNKDFVVSFVTNGMLLNKKTIKNLQKKISLLVVSRLMSINGFFLFRQDYISYFYIIDMRMSKIVKNISKLFKIE